MKKSIFIFALPLLSSFSWAAPSITGAPSSISGGASVTLSGSAFGTKAHAAPLLWETFDSAKYIPGHWTKDDEPAWTAAANNGTAVTASGCYSGSKCIVNHVSNPNGVNKWATNARAIQKSQQIYFSYRIRTDKFGSAPYGIGKFGRVTTDVPGGSYNGPGSIGLSSWNIGANTGTGWLYIPLAAEIFTYLKPDSTQIMVNGAWERHEMFEKKSSPGVADGALYFRKGTGFEYLNTSALTRDTNAVDYQLQTLYLGGTAANFENGSTDAVIDFRLDDIYADDTLARVELCSGSSWSLRMQCDVQVPSAWTDNGITFAVNAGNFLADSVAYLYVVNADGIASNAHEVTITATTAVQKPSPPTGLRAD